MRLHLMRMMSMMMALCLLVTTLRAQQATLSGIITDKSSNLPLPGVTVAIGKTAIATDANGKFTIHFSPGDVVSFSYIGMQTVTQKLSASTTTLNIALESSQSGLDQVVVTGYQTQRKADLTGAVAVVNLTDIKDIPNSNPMQALQGHVPGLFVASDGDPGAKNNTIAVRGFNTLGFTAPLYVIDGVPTINPTVFQA